MKIGILSDIHDNLTKLREALQRLGEADELICCGDLCSPFIIKEMGEGFGRSIHVVFGNNDGDLYRITEVSKRFPQITLYGEFAELELDGQRFGVNHFDNLGRALAGGGHYDVVCFGHNHQYTVQNQGKTLMINPGEVFGGLTGQSTCVLYDSKKREAQRVDLS